MTASNNATGHARPRRTSHLIGWVRTWGASPQAPEASVVPVEAFTDVTLRQVVRISGGGRSARIRFTNEYGTTPLSIGAAQVGLSAPDGEIRPGSDRVLTFAGKPTVTVPAGAPILTDPVEMPLPALSMLCISVYLSGHVETPTCHGGMEATGWMTPGNSVAAAVLPVDAVPLPARAMLAAVEVLPDATAKTIVAIGDSLTDGFGSTPGAHRGWPEILAERLARRGGPAVYVSNQGISGNRVLKDGFGVSALARFDRDVLATPGLGYVVVVEGGNDIAMSFAAPDVDGPMAEFLKAFAGEPVTADDVIAGYHQLIVRAHQHGAKIYIATITPYEGSEAFATEGENARQAVNAWIRTSGAFDAVLDFEAVWRDPVRPSRHKDDLHAGDHVHGSDAGYKALADSIDLSLFE